MAKVEALRARIADIHPGCVVHAVEEFVDASNWPGLLPEAVDAVVDACDQGRAKAAIAAWALAAGVPLVTVGAAGGKRSPERVEVADLAETTHDPVLAALRQRLRKLHGAAKSGAIGIACVFSREPIVLPRRRERGLRHRRHAQLPRLRLERRRDRDLRPGGGDPCARIRRARALPIRPSRHPIIMGSAGC